MPLKTESVEEPVLNLTPMIDIVFLLVIFFMVGTRFANMEKQVDVKLPTVADVEALSDAPDPVVINVREDGEIVVNGETVDDEQLVELLEAARAEYSERAVLVRGDREGRYQNVMDVLAACNRARIQRISLANELRREEANR